MDNQQAKFILQSCHAGEAGSGDPQFAEALQLASRDTELADWFAREQALDAVVARKLKETPAPEELLERILAAQETAAPVQPRRAVTLLAIAATILLLGVLAALWFRPVASTVNLAAFEREMRANVSGTVRFSFTGANVGELQQWLSEQRGIAAFAIPAALKDKASIGCRTWTWNGKPVGLICFLLDGKQAVHLFVVDRTAVPDAPVGVAPHFTEAEGWTTAAWSDGEKLFLLMGRTSPETLRRLL
jgi:hypothetical protein